jgi:hypothetical protein
MIPMSLASSLERDGFAIVPGVVSDADCTTISKQLSAIDTEIAGKRNVLSLEWCARLADQLRRVSALHRVLSRHVAIQCSYFDKSPFLNWLVPIHQDLSIPVARRVEHPDLKGWSVKEDGLYVQPPAGMLEDLLAIRLHLDDSTHQNGPLRVVPGSHRSGRLSVAANAQLRKDPGEVECVVGRGGVVAMKPLLLHASSKSVSSKPRRVLHFLYGPESLPFGLSWALAV